MADALLPLLRGHIEREENYRSPQRGGGSPVAPPLRQPAEHRERLLQMLDQLVELSNQRPAEGRVPGADREVIAVRAEGGTTLSSDGLADKRQDVRLVWEDREAGLALLDAPRADLKHLRAKADRFADDSKVRPKGQRANASVIAPIEGIAFASVDELAGKNLREAVSRGLGPDDQRWFELACRGGSRSLPEENNKTREELTVALGLLKKAQPQEYLAAERLRIYLRLSLNEVRQLIELVDCIFEVDLVEPEIRNWLLFRDPPVRDIQGFHLDPPPADAPAVVLLDTGIASEHPLLKAAIRSSSSAVLSDDSPEDVDGHGTRMAGVGLYDDLGRAIEQGTASAEHWLQSVRLLVGDNVGTASEENRPFWPAITERAVSLAEEVPHAGQQGFAMATSAPLPPEQAGDASSWSDGLDKLAYNDGRGRLICVAAGNAPSSEISHWTGYPRANLACAIGDPAQAINALTVGAFTARVRLPPDADFEHFSPVAPDGGISPHTTAGTGDGAIKPEILLEGGNVAFDGAFPDASAETLVTLTTGHHFVTRPLGLLYATSNATAEASRMAAKIWAENPWLRPATVRGLMVHSARWTPAMLQQFPNLEERLRVCGYGVPDLPHALGCTSDRATVVVEDELPNAIGERESKRTVVKFFELPVPEDALLQLESTQVELAVTLSYLSEPNTFRGRTRSGLDLGWDMQGPSETAEGFLARVNGAYRVDHPDQAWVESFGWQIGKQRRSRGTVQSDRWKGSATDLAGHKLIAVYPKLGWWDRRPRLTELTQQFSLLISVAVPDLDIYTPIAQSLQVEVAAT